MHETWNEFCVLFIIKLFLAKNDLKPVNLPPSYRGQNKHLTFDQVRSCYIQESFKGRTVLMKLVFSYLLWAIFYYWNFILNKYHYFRYFSRSLYKNVWITLCNVYALCMIVYPFSGLYLSWYNFRKYCFPKRWISHVEEKNSSGVSLIFISFITEGFGSWDV